ncbi:TRAP transporter small permease [Roseovarius pacificus]|uniref:TRAP transporter small permease n=1 Tax=Roseovarius pacificus TaxID=337701 RepID=UPI002A18A97E|nr:TRAP transporter small permease [Roseovarius pacificus]
MNSISDAPSPGGGGLFRGIYNKMDTATTMIERLLFFICAIAIAVAMILTAVDVFLRYGFSSPLGWSFDFVMLYLMPAAYYLAFSHGMRIGAHLSVDFFADNFPKRLMRIVYPVLMMVAAVLVVVIGWLIADEAMTSFEAGETLLGSVRWPTWPTGAVISGSFLVLSVRLVLIAWHAAFLEE